MRLQVISGIIAHPELFDEIDFGISQVIENVDPYDDPTSNERISGIIAHRVHSWVIEISFFDDMVIFGIYRENRNYNGSYQTRHYAQCWSA